MKLKISWPEIEELLKKHYKILDVKLMICHVCEQDSEHYHYPDYIEGEVL